MNTSRSRIARYFWIGALAALLCLIVLLSLPLAEFVEQAKASAIVDKFAGHKKMVAAAAALAALLVGAWLLWKRQFRLIGAGAVLGVLLVMAAGVYQLQKSFPMARFFDAQRYGDSLDIVLGRGMLLSRYDPKPVLVQDNRSVQRAAFPVVDVHFHLESLPASMTPELLIAAMDKANVAQIVNLGGNQGMFEELAAKFHAPFPDRIIQFVKPDANALTRENGVPREIEWLKKAATLGARGMKENKSFGMGQLDQDGKVVPVDDPRLDPYWELASRLGWPVIIHTGEPTAFWHAIDKHNERFLELGEHPQFSLAGTDAPSFDVLKQQRERLLARHPGTNFVGAHLGMNPDDLKYTSELLDKYPNYYVDMSSVVSELGRQPYSARRFFIKYQDRVLFGSDGGYMLNPGSEWSAENMYKSYFEFLETDNEYAEYPLQSITKQGLWRVYGINLPPEVLEKVYVLNAQRLIPSEADVKARLAALDAPAAAIPQEAP